jgi:hypothetical protein
MAHQRPLDEMFERTHPPNELTRYMLKRQSQRRSGVYVSHLPPLSGCFLADSGHRHAVTKIIRHVNGKTQHRYYTNV